MNQIDAVHKMGFVLPVLLTVQYSLDTMVMCRLLLFETVQGLSSDKRLQARLVLNKILACSTPGSAQSNILKNLEGSYSVFNL